MRKLIIVLVLLLIIPANAQVYSFSASQKANLSLGEYYGGKYGLSLLVNGIMMQETWAGDYPSKIGWKGESIGVMQPQITTAQFVCKELGISIDRSLMRKWLLKDSAFNIMIGAWYINYLYEYFNHDIDKTILAYNVGMGNVARRGLVHDPNGYLNKVKRYIELLKEAGYGRR